MKHMSVYKILPALLICIAPSKSIAQAFYSSGANPSSIGTISVSIEDQARDACWTNLREVREYAEEKISSKGYSLAAEGGNYDFVIHLNAFRVNNDVCFGSYGIQIASISRKDGVFGFHEIGASGGVATRIDNFNRIMIEHVQKMIESM